MPATAFEASVPAFDFNQYLKTLNAAQFTMLNVAVPDFFKGLNAALSSGNLETLKDYLTWHFISTNAPLLSSAFVNENFSFYSRTLNGTKELQPRWKRCVTLTDRSLGEALGQKYVEKVFGNQAKEKTRELVTVIEKQMAADIDSLTWMSAETKQQALAKLKGVTKKIGYPERWRSYESVRITPGDLVGDEQRAHEFEVRRNLDKIGKPVDRQMPHLQPCRTARRAGVAA